MTSDDSTLDPAAADASATKPATLDPVGGATPLAPAAPPTASDEPASPEQTHSVVPNHALHKLHEFLNTLEAGVYRDMKDMIRFLRTHLPRPE